MGLFQTLNRHRMTTLAAVAAGSLAMTGAALAQDSHHYTVALANMSYGQPPSNLKVGDTITWVNNDTVPHTVTARDHSFDLRMNPGQSVRQTLTRAGNIPFFCIYHAEMRGVLNVAAN